MFPKNISAILKKSFMYAVLTSLIAYPTITVIIAISFMFRNQSFSFMGFDMTVSLVPNETGIGFDVDILYPISIICLFLVVFIVSFVSIYFYRKKKN